MDLLLSLWVLGVGLCAFRYMWLLRISEWARIVQFVPEFIRHRVRKELWYQIVRWQTWEGEQLILRRFVSNGDSVVDVGANAGAFTYALSKLVGDGCVYSFEPMPETFSFLGNNVRRLGLTNVCCFPCALGAEDGRGELTLFAIPNSKEIEIGASSLMGSPIHPREKSGSVSVSVNRFDDLGIGCVKFVKIDVEGGEYDVLRGMERTLVRHSPTLLIEICDPDSPVFGWLSDMGYTCFFLDNNLLVEKRGRELSPSPNYFFLKDKR